MVGWKAAHLDEIEEFDDAGCRYRPVRVHLGLTAFGASVWTAQAVGDLVINEHDPGDPTADQELLLVMRGHAVFEVDGERVDAPAGTFVSAPPGTQRRASATEAGTAILLIEGAGDALWLSRFFKADTVTGSGADVRLTLCSAATGSA